MGGHLIQNEQGNLDKRRLMDQENQGEVTGRLGWMKKKVTIQSETVEETKGRSHGEEFALLEGKGTLGIIRQKKKVTQDNF